MPLTSESDATGQLSSQPATTSGGKQRLRGPLSPESGFALTDGIARPLEEHIGDVRTRDTQPRRRHSYFAERRPRFLVRRSTGKLGVTMKISGKEIIARN